MTKRSVVLALTLALPVLVFASEPQSPMATRRDGHIITATGLTPGGRCAVIVSWRREGLVVESWKGGTADAEGTFSAAFESDAPSGGLVASADIESGRLHIDTGDGKFFRREDMPASRFKRNDAREVEALEFPAVRTLTVVVRRGEGAWVQRAGDASPLDADGELNHRIKTIPAGLIPIAGSEPAPRKLKKGDAVLVADLLLRVYASTEVGE